MPLEDTLRVVYCGAYDPVGWAHTLTERGFPQPRFENESTYPAFASPRDPAA